MSDHEQFMAMVIQQSKAGENYKAETLAEFVDRDLTLITGVPTSGSHHHSRIEALGDEKERRR